MDSPQKEGKPTQPRLRFLLLSFLSLMLCAGGAVLHYRKWAWGNFEQPTGWLLSMLFLVLAFSPSPQQIAARVRFSINRRTGFFIFWILIFTVSHLWHFKTAPWNGDGLFDESGWDLWFLKDYVIGHPFQAAWFHSPISRETLFHYYLWPFFSLFGFNILSFEAGLFVIWCATFLFTLLLVDWLFKSNLVTAITALVLNFLPFAFIYTFVGYRYPMATALAVASLYFLYRGFQTDSALALSLGGITAGLCLASSISGKQYLLVLLVSALLHAALNRGSLKARMKWRSIGIVVYGGLTAAMPILCYIAFNRHFYTLYESSFVESFWQALRGHPAPNDLAFYTTKFWECFFSVPGDRFFIPDALPIPLPYFCFLVPGLFLALWKKRYEIALLSLVPVAGALIAAAFENRLLLAIPFWVILMAFSVATLLELRLRPLFKWSIWGLSTVILLWGLIPSVRYIESKAKSPFSIYHFVQEQVAVSRFLKAIVAGKEPSNPPQLERDEFNRDTESDVPYDTLICQKDAYSITHLFLHDYDETKILSPSDGLPFILLSEQEIWRDNKRAFARYAPTGKDLKLIWEIDPKTSGIIRMLRTLGDLGTETSIAFSFHKRERKFYVLNLGADRIGPFQERVRALPDSF